MRNWATAKTANWWQQADKNYKQRQEYLPSEEYFQKHFNLDSVLEVGSGTGRLINNIQAEYKGAIDINPHLLKLVDDDVDKYNLDISKPIKLYKSYQLVFSFQVLQHLNHKSMLQAIKNMKHLSHKEIWLFEGQDPNADDGEITSDTGSYHHEYQKYLKCYKIDGLHGGKIKVFRAKV